MTLKGSYKIQVASKSSFTFHLHYSFFRDLYHVTLHRNVFFFQCIILKYVLYVRACVCISFLKSHVCLYVRVYVLLNISKYLVSHYGNHVLLETRICTCWIFVIEQSSRNSWEWHLLFSIYTAFLWRITPRRRRRNHTSRHQNQCFAFHTYIH